LITPSRKGDGLRAASAVAIAAALSVPAASHDPPPVLTGAPPHHGFRMGVNPFPHDWSDNPLEMLEIVTAAYDDANGHGDMIAHQIPDGVPWVELAAGEPLCPEVDEALDIRKDFSDVPIYLGLTPINGLRDGVAAYWGSSDLPPEWEDPAFDDPLVMETYVAWCRMMIERFEPEVLGFAVEPNMVALADKAPEKYPALRTLLERTYLALKTSHPDLPICVTLQIDYLVLEPDTQWQVLEDLLNFSDVVAVSTYPFFIPVLVGAIQPGEYPVDWLSRVADLAPQKPFMVSETGGAAEPVDIPSLGIHVPGTPAHQEGWIKFLLNQAELLNARWIVYYSVRDFDTYLSAAPGIPPDILDILTIFQDIGFVDERGVARPALAVWDHWLAQNVALTAETSGTPGKDLPP
jgi:hypothetical protein